MRVHDVPAGLAAIAIAAAFGFTLKAAGPKAEKGMQVYADQRCALSHSIGDKGNKKGPLDDVGSRLAATDLRGWIADAKAMTGKTEAPRKPAMKSCDLPNDDVEALVAYMSSLRT